MIANPLDTDPGPQFSPEEDAVVALRQSVAAEVDALRTSDAQVLDHVQLGQVIHIAEAGVLDLLKAEGVPEAGPVAERLDELTAATAGREDEHGVPDLSYNVAQSFTDAVDGEGRAIDPNRQAQNLRQARLATAAGETAMAVVGSVLNPRDMPRFVRSGHDAVRDYAHARGNSRAATQVLHDVLDRTQAVTTPAPSEEKTD